MSMAAAVLPGGRARCARRRLGRRRSDARVTSTPRFSSPWPNPRLYRAPHHCPLPFRLRRRWSCAWAPRSSKVRGPAAPHSEFTSQVGSKQRRSTAASSCDPCSRSRPIAGSLIRRLGPMPCCSAGSRVSVLHAVITREERTGGAVQQLCASEKSVDRLFKILSSEENSFNQEIKAYTAGIIVKLSSKLCLADIPGAANCISSLLDDAHSMNPAADTVSKNHMLYYSYETRRILTKVTDNVMSRARHCFKKASTLATGVNNGQQSIDIRNDEHPNTSSGADNKPLIVHGLRILAKLAKNPDNAIEICSTKGLFSRITAPIGNKLYKVFRDDGTAIEITEKSLQVLSKLVSGTDARQEICNSGLLNTIQPILTDDSRYNMLKVPAIKILTKLILTDSSRNESTIIDFINVLTGLFFDEANDSILRQIAGKALASLAMDRNMYCVTILKGNTGTEHSVVEHLSDMLSDSRNKLYRTSIANLLMQFCALRSEEARFHLAAVKTTILHEVLKTMCNVEPQTSTNQLDLPRGINKLGSRYERKHVHDSRTHNPDKGNRYNPPAPMEPGRRKALVAFLGLAVQMMCDKLLDETDFNAAFERIPVSEAELVDKLKETIEMCNKGSVALLKGKGPSADYLVIIKSVTKFIAWVMRTKPHYGLYFQEKNIDQKLEDASEAMRGLELTVLLSCSADEIWNYETLASIVKDAQGCISPQPPQPDDHI